MPTREHKFAREALNAEVTEIHAEAEVEGEADVAPVQIEAVRIAVDLDHDAALSRLFKNALEVDAVAIAREQLAAGEMAEKGDVRVVERAQHPLGHLIFRHLKPRMDRGDHEVEFLQRLLVVV